MLEHKLHRHALTAGRMTLTNSQNPTAPKLPESQHAYMNAFFDNVRMLLSVLGVDMLVPTVTIPASNPAVTTAESAERLTADFHSDKGVYRLKFRGSTPSLINTYLNGILLPDGKMLMLEGSPMASDSDLGPVQTKIRQRMIQEGLVVPEPSGLDHYVQTRNIVYNRPSSAAAILTGMVGYKEKDWRHVNRQNLKAQMDAGSPDAREIDVSTFPTIEIPRVASSAVE
jgi:hypothetical protein